MEAFDQDRTGSSEPQSAAGISKATLEILRALGVEEVELEVSEMYMEFIVMKAEGGEVVPIDCTDSGGGFGGMELLSATIVPVLARTEVLRKAELLTLATLEEVLDDVIRLVSSRRAEQQRSALLRTIGQVFGLKLTAAGSGNG